jgi:hypothetical protein
LRANAQVEPMEEEEGDPGSGVLQIEEREGDWLEEVEYPMEESTFESVMVALREKIAILYRPIFKQQREEKQQKADEIERQQMLQLKKEKDEADELKWKKEKVEKEMEEEDDHTPQRKKRGFARPVSLTPYGTVIRVS